MRLLSRVFNKARARRDAMQRMRRAIEEPDCPKPDISCPVIGSSGFQLGYEVGGRS